ncbi:efflux RND transporter periplasmic adaptor subunit [Orenia marismortui]|uniref:efflux RND transporter periplasmic adaptor subunit n=1 Tax=Orenia marismortui TaxID=46469 RepID=UPI000367D185|nr:efflux RND transporter periplasmic adaptor subunit [Orenia marismortui]
MKKIKALLILLTLAVLSLIIAGCGNSVAKEAAVKKVIRPVEYQKVELKKVDFTYGYSGTLEPNVSINVSFRIPGKIENIFVEVGNKVDEGQLLAELDKTDYKLQVKAMESNISQAKAGVSSSLAKVSQVESAIASVEAQYSEATSSFNRIKRLYQNNNVSKADYDKAKAAKESVEAKLKQVKAQLAEAKEGVENARARVDSYQSQLELAKLKLSYTELKAPMSGTIVKKDYEPNENISAGRPVFTLDGNGGFEVKVFVDENLISKIEEGQQVAIEVLALNKSNLQGRVDEIGRQIKGYKGNYPLTIRITKGLKELRAGMTAKVYFSFSEDKNKLILPVSAVIANDEGNFVYTLSKFSDGYAKVKKVRVETGKLNSKGIEILNGLKIGELVVTKGATQIVDNQEVRLLN